MNLQVWGQTPKNRLKKGFGYPSESSHCAWTFWETREGLLDLGCVTMTTSRQTLTLQQNPRL